ncbi:AAA family ATPase [Emergencia timonensis]|uniref:AAA family ATPase n=1 Tax=Emergencia timonensis TaxID=1776384 RepID=UPI003983F31B
MVYLEEFELPSYEFECRFFGGQKRTCYDTFYPFDIFPEKDLEELSFEPITIFYGSNGSGKTTLINVIAEHLSASRDAAYNKSNFFDLYVAGCRARWQYGYQDSTVITSDDVFDYIFNVRNINDGVDVKRDDLLEEYLDLKHTHFQMRSLDDYEQLKKVNQARRQSGSQFVRKNLMKNIPEKSNGESALMYFTNKIQENQIYLLDEPENSLSAEYQQELLQFIEDSARFFNCQFIIATHSPFLLAAKHVKIYDLDAKPVVVKRWTELENVRRYFDFFMAHAEEF